jgi:hypothetical protein
MSGINLVVGPPGAGKGLWLIQVVRDVLLDTNQTIVTNFAIKLPELNEWFQREYPDQAIDLHERIVFLSEEEIKSFYLIRSATVRLQPVTKEQEARNEFSDYEPAKQARPVCYILDEADIHFGAREYASHGRSVNYYNKQHRKLSDTVYYCCQAVDQLDKQIRMLAQQTIVLKNLRKQKKGIFTLPSLFCWSSYYQVPKQHDQPMQSGVFRVNIQHGLQNCFSTESGVGMAGTRADRDEKPKGLSVFWSIPVAILVAILVVKSPFLIGRVIAGGTMAGVKAAAGVNGVKPATPSTNALRNLATAESGPVVGTNQTGVVEGRKPFALHYERATPVEPEKPAVYLTGIVRYGRRATIYLSDGRVFTTDDAELQFVSDSMAIIANQRYEFDRGHRQTAPERSQGVLGAVTEVPLRRGFEGK